jgi:hypothetical protein
MTDHDDDPGFDSARALLVHDQTDWTGDGVAGQLVTLELSSTCGQPWPALCQLLPHEARALAFRLLELAEHAEHLTRPR